MAIELTSPILIHPYSTEPSASECENGNLAIGYDGSVWYNDNGTMKKEKIIFNSANDHIFVSGIIPYNVCRMYGHDIYGIDDISVGKYLEYNIKLSSGSTDNVILQILFCQKNSDGGYNITGKRINTILQNTYNVVINYTSGQAFPYGVCPNILY